MIYTFDLNASLPGSGVCGSELDHIAAASFSPGAEENFYLKVHIPSGIPSGTVSNSTVTFTGDS